MKPYIWKCPADRFLRENYPLRGAAFVAQQLGIEVKQVYHRARRKKIRTTHARGRPFARGEDARRHDLNKQQADGRIPC